MSRSNLIVTSILGFAITAVPAAAQLEERSAKNEVSVQAFGSFVKSTTGDGVDNSATNSGGVLGTYRRFLNVHNGIEAIYGYSLNTQSYGLESGLPGVKSYSHEATAAPTHDIPALAGVDRTTHRAEPSIGFGYRF